MNITELLLPQPLPVHHSPIHDDDLMSLWETALKKSGFSMRPSNERNTLTDAILTPTTHSDFITGNIPVHIKVIGRHMNGSFRCHIGTSKASRPIRSTELCRQMRLLAVFFRTENSKSQLVSSEFIFFPTWLLHLFRYTQHGGTPGRTDVRFLENANMAKEDHIYRLNHVLNTLFRFNIHQFDPVKMKSAIELSNFLFDSAGLNYLNLPRPYFSNEIQPFGSHQPSMYSTLLLLLHSPRPTKFKPMCFNCNTKPASRRRLCVACYRYQLKHGEARPLRLIVANRPGPQTHQWYRNLCGHGHWCETCKSYYLRHTKVRPPELFVKAAKRKVDVRNLVNWSTWSWDDIPVETVEAASAAIHNMNNNVVPQKSMDYYFGNNNNVGSPNSSSTSSVTSSPTTPPLPTVSYYKPHDHMPRRSSYYSTYSQSSSSIWQ
ncbi:hypothetical protein INT48_004052 [Thamnidium elegans]|uniref:GATA-type domain-containing protein n=1 Tax=Thamnidium elegans TaxID=101142 RepID=A0A8H7VWZ8_9FUNG|nr:hypothetical protein INT48_004052 [Thamnidium elegans]